MATITGLTAARMLAIEAASVVSGAVVGGNLILTKRDGTTINAGVVQGPTGSAGAAGATGTTGPAGAAGANGNTILSGSGAPTTQGVNGDFYIALGSPITLYGPKAGGSWPAGVSLGGGGGTSSLDTSFPVTLGVALSDETTAITASTSVAKATIRAPFAFTISEVRATQTTPGASVITIVNVKNTAGTTIFTTRPTIDATEKSSVTAATPAVLSITSIPNDEELSVYVDQVGTDTRGVKVWIIGTRDLTASTPTPGAPTSIGGTVGATNVSVNWVAPSYTGTSAITRYDVFYSSNGGSTWSTALTSGTTATSFNVTGLTSGTTYIFRVQAVNTSGGGAFGVSGNFTPGGAPGAPTGVVASVVSSTTATVTWTAPASTGGGSISSYTVEKSIDSGTSWTSAAGTITGTSLAATGLTAATPVIFRVRATNSLTFTGPNSTSSASVTPSNGTAPGAPTVGTPTATGATTATLTFTAPGSAGTLPGGTTATITGYVVERSTNSGTTWTTASSTVSGATATITGLSTSTAYIFRISATNSAGFTGSPSGNSSSVTTSGSGGAQTLTPTVFKYLNSVAGSEFSYTDAVSGGGDSVSVLPAAGNGFLIGQQVASSLSWNVYEGFLEFNTAVGGSTVSAESFKVTVTGATNVGVGFTLELYGYNYTAPVDATDWRTPTDLGALTLLASVGVTTSSSGVLTCTLSGTALRSYIQSNLATTSRFVLCSNRHRTTTPPSTPTTAEYIQLNGAACELAFTTA